MLLSAAFSLFIAASSAFLDDGLFKRQACNKDNCLRVVLATDSTGASTRGQKDCSAYFITTVAPCAVTTTTTVTTTLAGSSTTTSTLVIPNTANGVTTVKVTQFLTSTRINNVVQTIPTTVVATVTATVTVAAAARAKRDLEGPDRMLIERQQAAACTTSSVPVIPTYYSLCSGSVRFSSACSCNGITATTTTLATAPRSTVTVTATESNVSVMTRIVTVTSGAPNLSTYTSIASISISTVSVDVTASASLTVTSTTTVMQTVTAFSGSGSSLKGPSCNNVNSGALGAGGCSSSCYCDERAGFDSTGVCNDNNGGFCGNDCSTDADCPTGSACAGGPFIMSGCGRMTCVTFGSCTSTFSFKR